MSKQRKARTLREGLHRQRQGWTGYATRAILLASSLCRCLTAQEMQPRAYFPAPAGLNFYSVGYSNNSGGLLFDPSLPVEDAKVKAHITTLSFGQTLGVMGRTTQILAVLPYVVANLDGRISGSAEHAYRSGMADSVFRVSMNIHGAPAMDLKEYATYRQKTIVGASIAVAAPTGQYDPVRLINVGSNRWGFKPELGVSRAIGKWTVEGAFGAWLFTANNRFNGTLRRTQAPLGSVQAHVVRFLPHRTWLAFDGTFFTGGRGRTNGRDDAIYQRNTRLGASFGIAVSRRQAIKISFFDGVRTRFGSDIRSISVSYTVIWKRGSFKAD